MNILFATEYYEPFTPGGTPWSLRLLAGELVRRGDRVAIVTPNYGAPAREDMDGVAVVRFPFWRTLGPGPSLAPVRDHVNPLFHLLFARAVIRTARRFGADVLHAQEKHALVGTYLAGRWLRRPVFLSLRDFGLICPITTCLLAHRHIPADCSAVKLQRECAGVFLDRYVEGGFWRRLRIRASLALLYLDARLKAGIVRRVDGVTGVSESILEIYARAGRIAGARARVVYNLAPGRADIPAADRRPELARFGLPDRPLVLYVGKRSPGKGFPVLAEAARMLAVRRPEVCFVVVGDGGAGDLDRVGGNVRLLGSRPRADVDALYALAEVVVHPAVWPEPFSRVPLEAATFARAVVGTRIGGTPEAVEDEVTGVLVERSDAPALARALERLLGDAELRRELGRRAAQAVAGRFGAERVLPQLLAAYRDART
jgi:glycosyltransferase involved in cell wall biosynthesis